MEKEAPPWYDNILEAALTALLGLVQCCSRIGKSKKGYVYLGADDCDEGRIEDSDPDSVPNPLVEALPEE